MHLEGLRVFNYILKPIMQESWSYISWSGSADFFKKIEDIGKISEGPILITANVVGLFPNEPHWAGLEIFFLNEVEAEFLTSQYLQSFLWLRYTDDIFFMVSWRRKTRPVS